LTQRELYNQRLLKEAKDAVRRLHTRRHFLRESAMGLGALALGSLIGGCGGENNTAASVIDATNPLAPKLPPIAGKARSVIYLHSWSCSIINLI
jgi:hypothetical protein